MKLDCRRFIALIIAIKLTPIFTCVVEDELDDQNLFMLACKEGNVGLATRLIGKVNAGAHESLAICYGCLNGDEKIVDLLLKEGTANPAVLDGYPLRKAIERGHLDIVQLLLKDPRVDPNTQCGYPIRIACALGYNKIVEALLAHTIPVNPNVQFNAPLRNASRNGHHKVVELLLKHPLVDPSTWQSAALKEAAANGHDKVVELLLKDGKCSVFSMHTIIGEVVTLLEGLPLHLLFETWNGNVDIVQRYSLASLQPRQLDILWARARYHPEIQDLLRPFTSTNT